jgi:hypothetical protein
MDWNEGSVLQFLGFPFDLYFQRGARTIAHFAPGLSEPPRAMVTHRRPAT